MKKSIIAIALLVSIFTSLLAGCSNEIKNADENQETKIMVTEADLNAKLHSICKLATVEVFYHNVGTAVIPAQKGLTHVGEKDRKYWVEYTGSAKIGIDASKISAKIDGENITIVMPKAEILNEPQWDSQNAKVYTSPDSFNSNAISSDKKDSTVNDAQKEMRTQILENNELCVRAEDNARGIIDSFVEKMSEINGVKYHIIWEEYKKT